VDALQRLQPVDFSLVVVWAAIVAWGARSGVVRQLILTIGVYAAAVLAGSLYQPAAQAASAALGRNTLPQLELGAYVGLFFVMLVLIWIAARTAYPHTRLGGRRGTARLDRLLGALLGAVWGAMLLIALVTMLRLYVATPWPGQEETQRTVGAQLQRAQLPPVLELVLAPLWQAMALWFPERVSDSLRRL
jgi:uncharacterized membrane protein required for colicin V production